MAVANAVVREKSNADITPSLFAGGSATHLPATGACMFVCFWPVVTQSTLAHLPKYDRTRERDRNGVPSLAWNAGRLHSHLVAVGPILSGMYAQTKRTDFSVAVKKKPLDVGRGACAHGAVDGAV
jgi:hypothetical protein